eukprot:CAMPEP_0185856098 /NCGR_PEP_ID=MMETSP1354-20130828/27889_1 /TAXON_ID=708628 /ORGANISM="Erythrolobus madagascarensis, Strain CCMP3276" /LENGTH=425 /DNA_ID=CAMNT_0028558265 /DNA_START=742 /DNA_END=2016 /DNA_ORIENTATION=+
MSLLHPTAMAGIALNETRMQFALPVQLFPQHSGSMFLAGWEAAASGKLMNVLSLCVLAERRASAEFVLRQFPSKAERTCDVQDTLDTALRISAGLPYRSEYWIQLLLAHGASLDACDSHGRTALLVAVRCEILARERVRTQNLEPRLTQALLAAGSEANVFAAVGHQSALQLAVERGDMRIATLLLDAGADVAHRDWEGRTALFDAAFRSDAALMVLLLERGANVNHKDHQGHSVLMKAALRGDSNTARVLLASGANVDLEEPKGSTALMQACRRGHLDVVRLLCRHGANVNHVEKRGVTPLLCAIRSGNISVAEFLLAHGADLNLCEAGRRTPLIVATSLANSGMVALLLRHGADVNACDSSGSSALLKAALVGDTKLVKLLLSHGANLLQLDSRSDTATLFVARGDQMCPIDLLDHIQHKLRQ